MEASVAESASSQTPQTSAQAEPKARHNFYLQLKSKTELLVFATLKEVRKYCEDLDKSDIARVVKGFEMGFKPKTSMVLTVK